MSDQVTAHPVSEQNPYDYILKDFNLKNLSQIVILKHLNGLIHTDVKGFYQLVPEQIEIDFAAFSDEASGLPFPIVQVQQYPNSVKLSCRCSTPKYKLCEHQARVLYNILQRQDLLIFSTVTSGNKKLAKIAIDYGLEKEDNLDLLFNLRYENDQVTIRPKMDALQPFNKETQQNLQELLLPASKPKIKAPVKNNPGKMILVFGQHRYYNNLTVELFEAQTTKNGKVKNPLKGINPADLLFKTNDNDEVKFYSGITTFQQNYNNDQSEVEIEALKAIVKNPQQIPFYLQDSKQSVAIQASTIIAVNAHLLEVDLHLSVNQRDDYYEITGRLIIEGKSCELDNLVLVHQYFVKLNNQLYLIGRLDFLRVIGFFKKQSNKLILHKTKYPEFQKVILVPLEGSIHVDYSYLKPATKSQIEEKGFDLENEQLIYLSESEDYILLTPVMRYGNLEIPVLSKRKSRRRINWVISLPCIVMKMPNCSLSGTF
ncbi:hypothetical protein [Pedobacter sp. P26]|uniref:hypothetical protein n=1 Tax=Pedobacter sp. P26 TaxID=3423956 RepID=UPI003D675403